MPFTHRSHRAIRTSSPHCQSWCRVSYCGQCPHSNCPRPGHLWAFFSENTNNITTKIHVMMLGYVQFHFTCVHLCMIKLGTHCISKITQFIKNDILLLEIIRISLDISSQYQSHWSCMYINSPVHRSCKRELR